MYHSDWKFLSIFSVPFFPPPSRNAEFLIFREDARKHWDAARWDDSFPVSFSPRRETDVCRKRFDLKDLQSHLPIRAWFMLISFSRLPQLEEWKLVKICWNYSEWLICQYPRTRVLSMSLVHRHFCHEHMKSSVSWPLFSNTFAFTYSRSLARMHACEHVRHTTYAHALVENNVKETVRHLFTHATGENRA